LLPESSAGPATWDKVLYGLPGLPNHLIQKFGQLWLDLYYIGTLNVPLLDLALFDTVLSGAFMLLLPAFGSFSDRLATRWGRRRPLMAVLAPVAALGFMGLMWVPAKTATVVLLWYMGMSLLQRCQRLLQLCYRALGAQMALKSHQRVRVFAWTSVLGGVGLILGTAVPTYLETEWEYRAFGLAVAASIATFYGALVFFVKERSDLGQRKEGHEIVPAILQSCQNYPFVLYLLSQVKDSLSLQETYTFKWLFLLNKHQIFASFLTTFGTAFLISLLWIKLGARVENKNGAIIGYVCTILSVVVSLFLPAEAQPYSFGLAMLHSFLEGIGVGSRNTFLPAVAADCIEYDQLLHGNRREAQFKTTEDIVTNFYGVGYGITLALLGTVGFNAKAALQPGNVMWMMRGLQLFKIATHLLGVVVLYNFPITHRVHQAIIQQVVVRRKGLAVRDPVTGKMLPSAAQVAPVPVRANLDHFAVWEWRLARALLRRPPQGLVLIVVVQVLAGLGFLSLCAVAAGLASLHGGAAPSIMKALGGQGGGGEQRQGSGELAWLLQIEVTGGCLALGCILFNALRLPALLTLLRAWPRHAAFLPRYLLPATTQSTDTGRPSSPGGILLPYGDSEDNEKGTTPSWNPPPPAAPSPPEYFETRLGINDPLLHPR
jgi:Na+/melibiose symporter-like transporter